MHVLEDADQMARTRAAMLAFGAPFSVIIDEFDRLGQQAKELGFLKVASGPFVRSSYHARDMAEG
jgi:hypothetical protein